MPNCLWVRHLEQWQSSGIMLESFEGRKLQIVHVSFFLLQDYDIVVNRMSFTNFSEIFAVMSCYL